MAEITMTEKTCISANEREKDELTKSERRRLVGVSKHDKVNISEASTFHRNHKRTSDTSKKLNKAASMSNICHSERESREFVTQTQQVAGRLNEGCHPSNTQNNRCPHRRESTRPLSGYNIYRPASLCDVHGTMSSGNSEIGRCGSGLRQKAHSVAQLYSRRNHKSRKTNADSNNVKGHYSWSNINNHSDKIPNVSISATKNKSTSEPHLVPPRKFTNKPRPKGTIPFSEQRIHKSDSSCNDQGTYVGKAESFTNQKTVGKNINPSPDSGGKIYNRKRRKTNFEDHAIRSGFWSHRSDSPATNNDVPVKTSTSFNLSKSYYNSSKKETNEQRRKQIKSENVNSLGNSVKPKECPVMKTDGTSNKKPTLLFVIVFDEVESRTDFGGYFRQRVAGKFTDGFKIQRTEKTIHKKRNCTKVTLYFESKTRAIKARSAFLTSNRHKRTKLLVYFNDVDTKKLEVSDTVKRRARLDEHLRIMDNRSVQVLAVHEGKMRALKREQTKLQKKLKGKKLSLSEFETSKDEVTTIIEKLSELELQKAEFQYYKDYLYRNLNAIANNSKLDIEINKLRIEFGIECSRLTNALPIYARRSEILDVVRNYQVHVLIGETGSGKSTQITQYLLQAGYAENGLIVCTQPRKVAAVTLATHVSREMATNVGQIIGYHVGMQSKQTDLTKVLYVTDHILLNECLKDNELKKFSCIIIDEAHERSIFTDMLLGMIKSAMVKRPALKIVITSATINPDSFVSYFGGKEICPVLSVSGRTFPVENIFCKSEDDDNPFEEYADAAIQKSLELHNSNPPEAGDILVFLTSPLEVEKCCEQFVLQSTDGTAQCLPLHGKLRPDEQAKVFQASSCNKRKVVFATNCAETSITIPGVKFVIDTGLVKEMKYDSKRNIGTLRVCPISKSSAEQRRGRAGRTFHGECYRLYNKMVYNSMEPSSAPEILRVHLGQALLQLMDLGVNPLLFDFIEAPPHEAMENAMQCLTDIGAVAGGHITDVGRWLSKLPIEPRKAYLVKLGIDEGIPIEALVVAACGGREMFHRFGEEEKKKTADVKKLQFCHNEGDILTKLNIYREWDKIPERQKGKWCLDNCINTKSIRDVRELVNEMRVILKKEMNQDLPYAMKSPTEADLVLKGILLKVLKQNMCIFLGHEKAGFYSIHSQQRVQVHPTSVLKTLNIQRNILVYEDILQTSKDFITGITPVDETELCDLSSDIRLSCMALIENMCVSLVATFYCGTTITRKCIGSLHKNLKEIEEQLNEASENKTVVLDVNSERGEMQLFASKSDKQHTLDQLQNILMKLTMPFQQRCIEINVGKSDDVRIVLGAGYTVKDVLMPHQFRTIMIKKKVLSADEPHGVKIEDLFSSFRNIVEIKQCFREEAKNRGNWGTVTYNTSSDATAALSMFNATENSYYDVHPILPKSQSSTERKFKIKMSWCRRPSEQIAYVEMASFLDFSEAVREGVMRFRGLRVSVKASNITERYDTDNQLFLEGIPRDVTEEEIKSGLASCLNIPENEINVRIKKVLIPRQKVETSQRMRDAIYESVERTVQKYAKKTEFEISFLPDPVERPKCARYTVLITFKETEVGSAALSGMLKHTPAFGKYPTQVAEEFETSIAMQKNIFESVKDDLEFVANGISTARVKINTSKAGNIFLNINTNDPRKLARVKVLLHSILQGDKLECGSDNEVSKLFTKDGRAAMESIEKDIGSVIFVDSRTMTITVHGTKERRARSLSRISEYLVGLTGLTEKVIFLKGDGKPEGLMKEIVLNYLEKIRNLPGIRSLEVRYMKQQMTILGDEASIDETEKLIQQASEGLQVSPLPNTLDMPDCSVCCCPIEPNDMYRIECCGHPYCKECIKQQIRSAVQHKTFPVVCASENCDQTFVIEDLNSLILEGCTTQSDLVKASIADFVGRNKTSYRYCITPDCDMIYEITDKGLPFTCGQCHETMCTSCHIQYHNGITCSMYRAEQQEENKIDWWLREDPVNRKPCPTCRTPIEKISGCNHVAYESCRIHICWVCLKTFNSSSSSYDHLRKAHGSCF